MFVDADFAGGWSKFNSGYASSVLSEIGYKLMYCGYHIAWCSKVQTEITLSTSEVEYITLSQALMESSLEMEPFQEVNELFET